MKVSIPEETLVALSASIAQCHSGRQYRPTVVAMVENKWGNLLVVQSVHGSWAFPQGGIKQGEGLIDALLRELREELDFCSRKIQEVVAHVYTDSLPLVCGNRDGYAYKEYFYIHVRVVRTPTVGLRRTELSDYRWLRPDEAARFIERQNEPGDKVNQLLAAFRQVYPLVAN